MKQYNQYDHRVDAIGLHCPQPVINCKATLAKMAKGEILEFTASDRSSLEEIPRLVASLGDELIFVKESAGCYRFTIRRNSTSRKSYRKDRISVSGRNGSLLYSLGLLVGIRLLA